MSKNNHKIVIQQNTSQQNIPFIPGRPKKSHPTIPSIQSNHYLPLLTISQSDYILTDILDLTKTELKIKYFLIDRYFKSLPDYSPIIRMKDISSTIKVFPRNIYNSLSTLRQKQGWLFEENMLGDIVLISEPSSNKKEPSSSKKKNSSKLQ